jgi:hypothetical protein
MKKLSRILGILLALSLCLTVFAACGNKAPGKGSGNNTPPAKDLEVFQMPFHPCMKFSYPKYAHDTGYSVNGTHNDELYVNDVAQETIDEFFALDNEARKAALISDHSANNLRDYTITDISVSTRTNAKGVSIFTYELEATIENHTMYICYYAFEGIEEGWILCYTCMKHKTKSDQTLLETVFNTIEIVENTDEK